MQPRKRSRSSIFLSGGYAEKPRTIAAYRAGEDVDVKIESEDGTQHWAHRIVLKAGAEYFAGACTGVWTDVSEPTGVQSAVDCTAG